MQLDVFTPLNDGPMTAERIADAIGVRVPRLRPLLCALVVAELLAVDGYHFSNTPKADRFLVRPRPDYIDDGRNGYRQWRQDLVPLLLVETAPVLAEFQGVDHISRTGWPKR